MIAKKYGIDMNATTRAQRGHTQKSKTQERIHQEEREWNKHISPSHPYDRNHPITLVLNYPIRH